MRPEIRAHGGPLIRVKKEDLARVGVEMAAARTVGVQDGRPVLDGDRVLDVTNVVWCTGFQQDFSWIDLPVTGDDGWPLERRGVVDAGARASTSSGWRSSTRSPRCWSAAPAGTPSTSSSSSDARSATPDSGSSRRGCLARRPVSVPGATIPSQRRGEP